MQDHAYGLWDDRIILFLTGQLPAEEQVLLEEWIAADAAHRRYFLALRDAWQLGARPAEGRYNATVAWEQVAAGLKGHRASAGTEASGHVLQENAAASLLDQMARDATALPADIQAAAPGTVTPSLPGYREEVVHIAPWRRFLRMAAMFLLPFLLGGGLVFAWLYNKGGFGNDSSKWITVTSPKGATTQIRLSDGTRVWLNAGSKLQYAASYDRASREVKLEGEAFFDVHTNPHKPFHVKAAALDILALGTSFNVKAYPDEKTVVTTLVEGQVKINSLDVRRPFSIVMQPSERVTYHKTPGTKTPAPNAAAAGTDSAASLPIESKQVHNLEIYTGWKDGNWIVAAQSLEDMAAVLERRFNVTVVFHDEELKHYKFSGTFRQETLEQILDILKLTAPLKYAIGNGTVTLYLDQELKERYSGAIRSAQ